MATPQLSPGVLTREIDLTVGRAENVLDNIGAIAGPFSIGPVEEPVNISTERELLQVFGRPSEVNSDYWMSASSYLSYGGVLKAVRSDGDELNNSNAAVGAASSVLKIKNLDDYENQIINNVYFAAKNPGSWGNNLKVCIIDNKADQIIGINTSITGLSVGIAVTASLDNVQIPSNGSIEEFTGYLKGIVTGIENIGDVTNLSVKVVSRVSSDNVETFVSYVENSTFSSFSSQQEIFLTASDGTLIGLEGLLGSISEFTVFGGSTIDSQTNTEYFGVSAFGGSGQNALFAVSRNEEGAVSNVTIQNPGFGYNIGESLNIPGSLIGGGGSINNIGIITATSTGVGEATTYTASQFSTDGQGSGAIFNITRDEFGDITDIEIVSPGNQYSIEDTITILGSEIGGNDGDDDLVLQVLDITDLDNIIISISNVTEPSTFESSSVKDWYNEQTLNLENSTIFWRSIAERPVTNQYALDRNGSNDALHVVVVDDSGELSGISANILEKHLSLSKSIDAISAVNSPTRIWYKDYLATFSQYIFAGKDPSQEADNFHQTNPVPSGFSSGFNPISIGAGIWGQSASNKTFSSIGNKTYTLVGGSDYGNTGVRLGDLVKSYDLFSNSTEIDVDYLIYGPSMGNELESQAKANRLISIAQLRKDCIAVISPHRAGVVNIQNTEDQTNEIIKFFSALPSSSYAVFDSGYKYTFDRFNNKFRYIPCNADVAGLMARTTLTSFPWFSPAGQQRGVLNNAVKLAYNPNKDQRDRLYVARVNSIVNQPGVGILLFGDKTALEFASAFDRINVRRLFLTIQQALQRAADAQLFEFNDEITRSNFVNIVEPYLRDVQAKRGLFDFRVICDSSNNTPDVIDNNEFRADIFLKPTRSINYVTLSFVATRTGVSFEEVVGNV